MVLLPVPDGMVADAAPRPLAAPMRPFQYPISDIGPVLGVPGSVFRLYRHSLLPQRQQPATLPQAHSWHPFLGGGFGGGGGLFSVAGGFGCF